MKVHFSVYKEWTVVQIVGRIDSFTYPLLESDLQILLRTGAKHIVLDVSENTHMNLSGYRLLKQTFESIKSCQGEMMMLSPSEDFMKHLDYFIKPNEIKIGNRLEDLLGV